jgi:nucleotidyltransferase substrate binding protein (TIGR01987 family)
MENRLDITALKKATAAFDNALAFAGKVESKPKKDLEFFELESARASAIQHFEICYELCWKTMKRFIEMDIGAEADILTRKDFFRVSAEKCLIEDFDRWARFHRARNLTSHVYNEETASEIYAMAKLFADDLHTFVKTMEERI